MSRWCACRPLRRARSGGRARPPAAARARRRARPAAPGGGADRRSERCGRRRRWSAAPAAPLAVAAGLELDRARDHPASWPPGKRWPPSPLRWQPRHSCAARGPRACWCAVSCIGCVGVADDAAGPRRRSSITGKLNWWQPAQKAGPPKSARTSVSCGEAGAVPGATASRPSRRWQAAQVTPSSASAPPPRLHLARAARAAARGSGRTRRAAGPCTRAGRSRWSRRPAVAALPPSRRERRREHEARPARWRWRARRRRSGRARAETDRRATSASSRQRRPALTAWRRRPPRSGVNLVGGEPAQPARAPASGRRCPCATSSVAARVP